MLATQLAGFDQAGPDLFKRNALFVPLRHQDVFNIMVCTRFSIFFHLPAPFSPVNRRAKVESGGCENASEIVRAALRTLEREERQREAKRDAPRKAIDDGDGGCGGGKLFPRKKR